MTKRTTTTAPKPRVCHSCGEVLTWNPDKVSEAMPDAPVRGGIEGHREGCAWLARSRAYNANLSERLNRARAHSTRENDMATSIDHRERAEAMNLTDLKAALVRLGVEGSSKLNKADAVKAYVKAQAAKAKKRAEGKTAKAEGGSVDRNLDYAFSWSTKNGECVGQSRVGNWRDGRYRIKAYLDAKGLDADKVQDMLRKALDSIRAGESIKISDVSIEVFAKGSAPKAASNGDGKPKSTRKPRSPKAASADGTAAEVTEPSATSEPAEGALV